MNGVSISCTQLTETVSTQWERIDHPPYYRLIDKVSQSTSVAALESRSNTPVQTTSPENEPEIVSGSKTPTIERAVSEERSGSIGSAKAFAESGKFLKFRSPNFQPGPTIY